MSRILLADDSPHAQRMGERILRDEGHEVVVVSDGKVAVLRLEDAQPDLIIADISMPEVSGFELCEYVKRTTGIPVILTAGPVEPIDEAEVDRVRRWRSAQAVRGERAAGIGGTFRYRPEEADGSGGAVRGDAGAIGGGNRSRAGARGGYDCAR